MARNLIVYAAGLALCAGPTAWAQQQQQQQSQQSQKEQQRQQGGQGSERQQGQHQQQQAPDGFVYIREDVVYLMANEPQPHLTAALARYAAGDKRAAAQEMKIAAAFLDLQANRGQQQGENQKLKEASQELKRLADQFAGKGKQVGEQGQQQQQQQQGQQPQQASREQVMDLHRTFAKANAALASHFNALAKAELHDKKYIAAGYDLNAAATSLAQAYVWTGQQPQGQTLDNAGIVASNLVGEDIGAALRRARQQSGGNADANANAGAAAASDNARTAGARLNPITGTTPAEAKNITEHARTISDALDKDIQQFNSQLEQQGGRAGQGQQGNVGSGQAGRTGSSSSSSGASQGEGK